jgi:plastocyanin
MLRRTTIASAAVAVLAASALVTAPAGAATKKLTIKGSLHFNGGVDVRDDQRFVPNVLTVKSGDTVKVSNRARTRDPHTITFAKKRDLPTSFEDSAKLQQRYMTAHGADQSSDAPPTNLQVFNFQAVSDSNPAVFDGVGDSVFFQGKKGPSMKIGAKKGANLYYFCLIHAWMQGSIQVR